MTLLPPTAKPSKTHAGRTTVVATSRPVLHTADRVARSGSVMSLPTPGETRTGRTAVVATCNLAQVAAYQVMHVRPGGGMRAERAAVVLVSEPARLDGGIRASRLLSDRAAHARPVGEGRTGPRSALLSEPDYREAVLS